jgi:two-component system, OmpR family, response regulator
MTYSPIVSAQQQVLIVDDDAGLRSEVSRYLTDYGYRTHVAGDAVEMDRLLGVTPIDLLILDLVLPGEDGLSICRRMSQGPGPAIIIVSARAEQVDRVLGLELGADDYLGKPCAPRELLARVRSVLRRRAAGGGERRPHGGYLFAGLMLDRARAQLRDPSGAAIMLSPGEMALLQIFLEHPREILSRESLIRMARGDIDGDLHRAMEVQISRLRRKLNGGGSQELIKTVRGAGYILDASVSPL